jgi:hypothetical protein
MRSNLADEVVGDVRRIFSGEILFAEELFAFDV